MNNIKTIFCYLGFVLLLNLSKDKDRILKDGEAWCKWKNMPFTMWNMCMLMVIFKELRNIFYHRVGSKSCLLSWLFPRLESLYITTPRQNIDGGLVIQHGFATIISAERIGENCKIYQQVTIGYNHALKAPVLGDNVEVCCGAKVIGGITVGHNVIVGANALVVKDLESNSIVGGIPAMVLKKLR